MSVRRRDKTAFSAWLEAERKRHGLKAEEVARRLRDLGYQAEDSTYRTWEANRRPSADTVAALERMFETAAPGDGEPGAGDIAAAIRLQAESNDRLAIALGRQADAFNALAKSIDAAATGVVGQVGGFGTMLRDLLAVAREPVTAAPAAAEPPVRGGSRGSRAKGTHGR